MTVPTIEYNQRFRTCATLVIATCILTTVAAAQELRSLDQLVRPDVAIFVELHQPDARWTRFENSELGHRWKETDAARAVSNTDFVRRWRAIDEHCRATIGETLTHRIRGLFGESVALAVHVGEGGPQGILLARGKSAQAVSQTIEDWNRLEPPAELQKRGTDSQSYFARYRDKNDAASVVFYAVHDDLFWLTDRQDLLQESLALYAASRQSPSTPPTSLATAPEYRETQSDRGNENLMTLYLAAPRWNGWLGRQLDRDPPGRLLFAGWQRLRNLTVTFRLEPEPGAILTANLDRDQLGDGWKTFVSKSRGPITAVQDVPPDAVLALGGHIPPTPLIRGLRTLINDRERQDWERLDRMGTSILLGHDLWTEAAPALLQDWTASVALRPGTQQTPTRLHPFVATWVSHYPAGNDSNGVAAALENLAGFAVNAVGVTLNAQDSAPTVHVQRNQTADGVRWNVRGRREGEIAVFAGPTRLAISSSVAELDAVLSHEQPRPGTLSRTAERDFPQAAAYAWIDLAALRRHPAWNWLTGDEGRGRMPRIVGRELGKLLDQVHVSLELDDARIRVQAGGLVDAATTGSDRP